MLSCRQHQAAALADNQKPVSGLCLHCQQRGGASTHTVPNATPDQPRTSDRHHRNPTRSDSSGSAAKVNAGPVPRGTPRRGGRTPSAPLPSPVSALWPRHCWFAALPVWRYVTNISQGVYQSSSGCRTETMPGNCDSKMAQETVLSSTALVQHRTTAQHTAPSAAKQQAVTACRNAGPQPDTRACSVQNCGGDIPAAALPLFSSLAATSLPLPPAGQELREQRQTTTLRSV